MPRETLEQQEPNSAVSDEPKDSQEASGQLRIKTQVGRLPGSYESRCCFGGSSEMIGAHSAHTGGEVRVQGSTGGCRKQESAQRDQISCCFWSIMISCLFIFCCRDLKGNVGAWGDGSVLRALAALPENPGLSVSSHSAASVPG